MISITHYNIEHWRNACFFETCKKSVIDNRNIVLLLHGLPDSVQDFSIDERLLLSQEDMAKINHARQETKEKEKSKESLDSRLKELKNQGKTWNQAYDKLHLERVSKIEKSRLKSLWKNI